MTKSTEMNDKMNEMNDKNVWNQHKNAQHHFANREWCKLCKLCRVKLRLKSASQMTQWKHTKSEKAGQFQKIHIVLHFSFHICVTLCTWKWAAVTAPIIMKYTKKNNYLDRYIGAFFSLSPFFLCPSSLGSAIRELSVGNDIFCYCCCIALISMHSTQSICLRQGNCQTLLSLSPCMWARTQHIKT